MYPGERLAPSARPKLHSKELFSCLVNTSDPCLTDIVDPYSGSCLPPMPTIPMEGTVGRRGNAKEVDFPGLVSIVSSGGKKYPMRGWDLYPLVASLGSCGIRIPIFISPTLLS